MFPLLNHFFVFSICMVLLSPSMSCFKCCFRCLETCWMSRRTHCPNRFSIWNDANPPSKHSMLAKCWQHNKDNFSGLKPFCQDNRCLVHFVNAHFPKKTSWILNPPSWAFLHPHSWWCFSSIWSSIIHHPSSIIQVWIFIRWTEALLSFNLGVSLNLKLQISEQHHNRSDSDPRPFTNMWRFQVWVDSINVIANPYGVSFLKFEFKYRAHYFPPSNQHVVQ